MPGKITEHEEIIKMLKVGNFRIECPDTNQEVPLKSTELFDNNNFTEDALEIYQQQLLEIRERKEQLRKLKEIGVTKSEIGAHSINIGLILERLAPGLGSFRFNTNDCRSLFDPIDYVIFEGLATKGRVDKIFFVDIKTGGARLNKRQKEIKTVVNDKKVAFKKF